MWKGIPYTQDQALVQLHEAANAPIFGLHDSEMGQGIVGGPLMEITALSQNSVKVALRILHGEQPGSIKIPVQGQGKPVYDWRELRRWHIDESRLPAGSTILFRQPTPWQLYGRYVIGTVALFGFAAIFIFILFLNLAKRRRAERDVRESEERLSLRNRRRKYRYLDARAFEKIISGSRRIGATCSESPMKPSSTIKHFCKPFIPTIVSRSLAPCVMPSSTEADYVAEYRIVLPDGSERWLASRGRLYPERNGKAERMGGVAIDITERKLAEAQVRDLRKQLAHAARVSIMGELAASIAHELNQPLGAILLNAEAAEYAPESATIANGRVARHPQRHQQGRLPRGRSHPPYEGAAPPARIRTSPSASQSAARKRFCG